jgi:hypothetical protein
MGVDAGLVSGNGLVGHVSSINHFGLLLYFVEFAKLSKFFL